MGTLKTVMAATALFSVCWCLACSSSTTFDQNHNTDGGSNADSSPPPDDSQYNPPQDTNQPDTSGPDTTDTADATSDSSDDVNTPDAGSGSDTAIGNDAKDTADANDATDTGSADGDSGTIVIPPSPDTFVGIDTPAHEISPDITNTADNNETSSIDSDNSPDTSASSDSADVEEAEVAIEPTCLCDDDDACTTDICVDGECLHVPTFWCVECADDAECAGVGWCPGPANTSILLATGKCGIDGTCEAVGKQCSAGEICAMYDNIDGPYAWGAECIPTPECYIDAECNDEDICNGTETCDANKCVDGSPLVCNDFNACTNDFCDSVDGCVYENNSNPCSDGDACTVDDICVNGKCASGNQKNCDDNNECTGDVCVPASGCMTFNMPKGTGCDDSNACTTNDTCQVGKCVGGSAPDCDDKNVCTADSCDPTIGCQHSAVSNGTSCLDDTVCNGAETCQSGLCKSGVALDCGDSNQCTNDSCNVATGCVHTDKPDTDSDGLCDLADNCPAIANADQADMDKDGVGDVCDPDKDGDSISNSADNCPNVPNLGQADMDKDGVGDVCDSVNTCKLSADGLPANFYIPVPLCINGCFVGSQIVCTKCISTHTNCTSDNDGDGPSMCYGDCNDNTGGVKYSCWPAEQPPPACGGSVWTPQ